MSVDLLMLRGEQDGTFNLAVGEPIFLQESTWFSNYALGIGVNPRYPSFGGNEELIASIRKTNPNAKKHIVVANGAKQAILAALYGFRTRSFNTKRVATMSAPYWPSYATLLKLNSLGFQSMWNSIATDLTIATSPNNPDGSEFAGECEIWDAAYFHWLYRAKAVPAAEVSIWSIAKMYGLSGVRVGYMTTDDDVLAQLGREYVEKTTSGVCNDAQERVTKLLEQVAASNVEPEFAKAQKVLHANGEIFNAYLQNHIVECRGVPVGGAGMFAYFRVADPARFDKALEAAKVKVIPGEACGGNKGWYRMSCGHRNSYTEQALAALSQKLLDPAL